MTVKEFKNAMKRGLGRCVLELERTENIEKYRAVVLWGCTHNFSYDTQSEGTRAQYFYDLIACYPDETPFVEEVAMRLDRFSVKTYEDWLLVHCVELLTLFAQRGNLRAREALQAAYERFYAAVRAHKRRPQNYFRQRDLLEDICLALLSFASEEETLAMCEQIGEFYIGRTFYNGCDFERIYDRLIESPCYAAVAASDSPAIKAFVAAVEEEKEERARWLAERERKLASGEIQKPKRAEPEYGEESSTPVERLLHDYRTEDETTLVEMITFDCPSTGQNESGWHANWMACIEGFERDLPLPEELLFYIYEHEICACCRYSAVKEIIRRGLATEELRAEWKYDSNEDIRALAKK